MMIGHILRYLPAQVISPIAQLASMLLWTHWLVPSEMGAFTLVTVAQEIAYLACLGWFSLYGLRYLPSDTDVDGRRRYLGTENVVVLASIAGSLVAGVLAAWTLPGWSHSLLPICAVGLFFATKGLNAHYAERARAQSAFTAYTLLQTIGPVLGLALGWLALSRIEASAVALLLAYAAAQALGTLLALPGLGMHWRLPRPDTHLLRAAAAFGGPMLGLFYLGWVAENYIRYLVQWQAGAATLGLMIVGWSLGRRCASVASMLVVTAPFPIAARLLNEGRRDEALKQMGVNAALLLGVLVPVTAALWIMGPSLISLSVSVQYRETTSELLGLSALAGALRNLHVHSTDALMVLERRLGLVAVIDVVEIVLCGGASLLGLRTHGLHGAIIGQAIGSALTLVLCVGVARARLGFHWPWRHTAKIAVASAVMTLGLVLMHLNPGPRSLIIGTIAGSVMYAAACALLFKTELRQLWVARQAARQG